MRRLAYSGYFTGMSIFSSSPSALLSSRGMSLSRMVICCAAASVTSVDMMHVKRIMMMTPFRMSSFTRYPPSLVLMFIPTMTMAMAPAAWAEVRPNIMLPDERGMRKKKLAI